MPLLAELRPGEKARIVTVVGDDFVSLRLREMGLIEGEVVEFLGTAPLGDPLEVRVGDYRLSLRRAEASRVRVVAIASSEPSSQVDP
ncbi:MAG: iron transporter [Gemmataceae bacterium]